MKFSVESLYNWYRKTLRHPQYGWLVVLGTLLYFLSPIDISPDFLPIAGQIDDVALITLLFAELSQMLVERLKARQGEGQAKAPNSTGEESNKSNSPGDTRSKSTVDVEAASVE
ncbi:MAG: DUF1232 domain-containing protein [Oscillatoria sp. SIO1A7]|nr:DUF1232 domain-containing protein [Oscillatoria sp. SIO1A7]